MIDGLLSETYGTFQRIAYPSPRSWSFRTGSNPALICHKDCRSNGRQQANVADYAKDDQKDFQHGTHNDDDDDDEFR